MKPFNRLVFLAFCTVQSVCPSFAQDSFAEGRAAYKAGNYKLAATCLRKAVSEDEADPNRRYYLTNSLANTDELGAAKQQYEMCVRLSPDSNAAKLSKAALATAPHPYKPRPMNYYAGDFDPNVWFKDQPGVVKTAQSLPAPTSSSPDGRHVRQMV